MRNGSILRRLQTAIYKPHSILIHLLTKLSPFLSDKLYLKLLFPLRTGYLLNLKNPQTYNEKLQWLKLYYRDSRLPALVDKYEYKKFVKEKIGGEFIIQTYGIWNSFDEVDFASLPNQFVLKTTHDQGGVIICFDKSNFDYQGAKKKMTKHLKRNLFYLMREWPYKYVRPRILAEKLLVDEEKGDLWDYKFYCFNGKPIYMYISMGRLRDKTHFYFYDMDFNFLNIKRSNYRPGDAVIEKPRNWDRMIKLAGVLSEGQPHVRIDFYEVGGNIYVGEYTLFQGGGMMPFIPEEWDYKFGQHLILPQKNID